jgi:hypothetical protein
MLKEERAMQIENCKMKIANRGRVRAQVIECMSTSARAGGEACRLNERASSTARICNLQFAICNFQYLVLTAIAMICFGVPSEVTAQTIPDKIVASVTNGSQATPDVITYSDLVWQLALEPGRPSPARPSAEDLKQALDTMVQQTLVLQEAKKLPLAQTPDVQKDFDKKVKDRLDDVIRAFGSRALLEERMKLVGLTSEQLDQILRDRQTMDSYVDFRFRAFAVVSTKEISDRYEKLYGPQRGSGRIVKTLDQARDEIERDLTEEKIQAEIDNFIDRLVDQPGTEIVILNPVQAGAALF